MKKLFLTSIAALLPATGTGHAAEPGTWEDCFSHNLPERPTCVWRSCEGNWPGPKDQCSPKAQTPRWLARTTAQEKRCRAKTLSGEVTFKRIIRFESLYAGVSQTQ